VSALCDRPPANSCVAARQEALIGWVPELLCSTAPQRAAGRFLPAELLPYAAAQLLPVLLLPPELARAGRRAPQAANQHHASDDLPGGGAGELAGTPLSGLQCCGCAVRRGVGCQGTQRRRLPSSGAQGTCGQLAARNSSQGCRALVPACTGLVPFVVAALRKLTNFCVRSLLRTARHASARELRCYYAADMSGVPRQPGDMHLLRPTRYTSAKGAWMRLQASLRACTMCAAVREVPYQLLQGINRPPWRPGTPRLCWVACQPGVGLQADLRISHAAE